MQTMGREPRSFDIDLSASRHDEAARERVTIPATLRNEMKTDAPERPCARCGNPFTTTPTRRMLCARCYADG